MAYADLDLLVLDPLDMVKCVTGNEKKDSAVSDSRQPMGDGFKFGRCPHSIR